MTQATLHELYVWKLSKELSKEYDHVSTNVTISSRTQTLAEIDVLAERDGEVHVFEVKRSFRPTKARQQFRKIQRHFSREIARFFFYAADADQMLEMTLETR